MLPSARCLFSVFIVEIAEGQLAFGMNRTGARSLADLSRLNAPVPASLITRRAIRLINAACRVGCPWERSPRSGLAFTGS
jgi:hypothetical protein